MKYIFEKPYQFEGETYTNIEFDLDSLKGSDIAAVKRKYVVAGGAALVPTSDMEFSVLLLNRVTKKPIEFFNGLPARDYVQLTLTVSNFLMQ